MNAQIEILQQCKFEPLFGTYVHEFGHGVVFLANGHSILNLFVRGANAGGGRGGHVRPSALDYTGRPRVPDFPKYMAACAIAGAVSEHLILGVRPSPYLMDGWIDDRHIWLTTLLSYEVKPAMEIEADSPLGRQMLDLIRSLQFYCPVSPELQHKAVNAAYEAWVAVSERLVRIQTMAWKAVRERRVVYRRNASTTRRLNFLLSQTDLGEERRTR